jgi:hypothetical protein
MNDQQKNGQDSRERDQEIRAALDQHWGASDATDFETEHRTYREDAVLEYPQSGERMRGRCNTPELARLVRRIYGCRASRDRVAEVKDGKHAWTPRCMELGRLVALPQLE